MNYCLIFAAGSGTRMRSETPKQFIKVYDKPILAHTLSIFQNSEIIDGIIVVTRSEYIDIVKKYKSDFGFTKIMNVVAGGETAFDSQKLGLDLIGEFANENDIVFIHDGVRPLINGELLKECFHTILENGSAITISPAAETISVLNDKGMIEKLLPRQKCMLARAPQVFYYKDIYSAHLKAKKDGKKFIDSASLMLNYGFKMNVVEGPIENIKITTKYDLMLFELWMNKNEKNRNR